MQRRTILKGLGAASAFALLPRERLYAQDNWPSRPVTMIVPFPPGGQADFAARPIAAALEKLLGQPVVVENRGGGGGAIGIVAATRAAPDGYTLLMSLPSLVVLPEADRILGREPSYAVSQLTPIARILADPTLLAVPVGSSWKTAAEFIEDAKKRPEAISYGSSGRYGTLHIAMEMLAASAGMKLLHVPFQGAGPALKALLGGEVQAIGTTPGVLKQHVDAGTLRVLANWGAERTALFPNVPTFKELGYTDVEYYNWAGLFAPNGVPSAILRRLGELTKQVMNQPESTKAFETGGSPPAYLNAEDFKAFMDKDGARLAAAVKKIGKVE